MSQALYRKWRPQTWDDVIGQEHVVTTLRNAVAADRVAHAYLFAGPRGTGKTTSARLLAKAVNCLDPDLSVRPCDICEHCKLINTGRFLDLIEIDAASNTSVDDVRDLRDKINFSPNMGRFKVYIIDEVHMLSTAAFNALLKTLEEPPPHAIFILATTEIHKIPATVTSRCQRHEFRRISAGEIVNHLKRIIQEEKIEADDEATMLIARQATGSMRDAISLLDVLASTGAKITFELAQDVMGTATSEIVLELVSALQENEPGRGLDLIHLALDSGADARQFARQIVDYLRNLLLLRMGSKVQLDASVEVRQRMSKQAQAYEIHEILHTIQEFNSAAAELKSSWQPALSLEIALVGSLNPVTAAPAAPPEKGGGGVESPKKADKKIQHRVPDIEPPVENPGPASTSELDMVRSKWREIKGAVRKINSSTGGLLNSSTLLEIRGSELFLGFASDTVKQIMEGESHVEFAQQGIEEVLGRKMAIRCVIASDASEIPDDLKSDGMVAAAVRLGGKIVHTREMPTKGSKKQ